LPSIVAEEAKPSPDGPAASKKQASLLAILLATIPVLGTVTVAAIGKCSTGGASTHKPASKDLAQTAFGKFEGAIARYLGAADDFASTFERRGREAFKSLIAQQEIHDRGVQVSSAFHELSDNGPRYLRDLQGLLPGNPSLLQDATDLRSFVLRDVHENEVRPLNNVIDVINDTQNSVRAKTIDEQMARVATAAANIRKEVTRASEQLDNLRRGFGSAVVSLDTGH
jgi:hypothetical protein